MVTFCGFPKPHWKDIRTTNVIESPFAAVQLRTGAAKRYQESRQRHRGDLENPAGGGKTISASSRAAPGSRGRGRSCICRWMDGSPPEFDNSEFVQELESRGFYVATQARSNYRWTTFSIPSSLNRYYVHDEYLSPGNKSSRRLAAQADDHALGRILTTLGYRYVHVSSGIEWSNTSRSADLVVDFTPAGLLLSGDKTEDPFAFKRATSLSSRFTDSLLPTTVARPFLSSEFDIHPDDPFAYRWQHPLRTLAWLDFMNEVAGMDGPKFVFAHLLKPHGPNSFDRHGNIAFDSGGWPDEHDPTVPEAFYGQVIWVNGRMIEVVDAILENVRRTTYHRVIVIAGDHGFLRYLEHIPYAHDILAAYLLPDGGESALYPSITSVNSFRVILDYYFWTRPRAAGG